MSIKQKLLEIEIVEDNLYLEKYVKLISDNLTRKQEKFKTQKHHIIPKCYYRYNNLDVDNSSNNVVNLLYKDHILAHYYLYLAAKTTRYRYAFSTAFLYLLSAKHSNIPNTNIKKLDYLDIQFDELQSIYEENIKLKSEAQKGKNKGIKKGPMKPETRKKLSLAHKGKTSWNKGKKFPNSCSDETRLKHKLNSSNRVAINKDNKELHILKSDLDKYLQDGWNLGKSYDNKNKILKINSDKIRNDKISQTLKGHSISEETKKKISEKLKGKSYGHSSKGYCWVNNTKEECLILKNNLKTFLIENKEYIKGRLTKPFRRK